MKVKMHYPQDKPDWEYSNKQTLTRWQSFAMASHGIVTPANIVSVLGLILVVIGCVYIYAGHLEIGTLAILFGRFMDLIDGIVAEKTKTKSPFGEIVDTTCDKLTIFALVITAYATSALSGVLLTILFLHHASTALFSLFFARRYNIHTTKLGKQAMFVSWVVIISSLGVQAYDFMYGNVIVYVLTAVYAIFATLAAYSYYAELQKKIVKRMKSSTWSSSVATIIFVENKKASNYRRSRRWITRIERKLKIKRITIDVADVNKKLIKAISKAQDDGKVLVTVAGGDGTVSNIANILIKTDDEALLSDVYFLPLWGGNANDVATMLNGLSSQSTLHHLLERSSIVGVPTIEVHLTHETSDRRIYACGYASFGATAYAARQINDERLANRSIVRFFPPLFVIRELIAVIKALMDAPLFTARHQGSVSQHYEHTFINGSRIAKVNRVPISLTEPAFFHAAVDRKHPSYIIELLRIVFKRSRKEYVQRNKVTFTTGSDIDAQIDGEVYKVKSGTRVSIRSHDQLLNCVSIKLD
jgi:phosphatidylglycerophosphate synthase/diacylglycerol kinase family enzyme